MLAYPLGEAETMLDEKLNAAESSLQNCEEDLEFLREQITVRSFRLREAHVWEVMILALLLTLTLCRHWRLPRRVCTTGML